MVSQISNTQARIANWVSIALAIIILLVRFFGGRHYHRSLFDTTAVVILVSIAILIARIVISNLVLECGTADDVLLHGVTYYDHLDLEKIKAGTILSLFSRLLITTLYWLQCVLLLLFYRRILMHIYWVKICVRTTWVAMGTSYIAVVLATFLECHPFRLYWQIQPDPGHCARAYVQLFVQCICNIVIDILLLAMSYPVLRTRGHEWWQKCQLALLYLLGTFCIITTCIRIAYIHGSDSAQPTRSFWASTQGVISTFVANAPNIYGQLKLRRRQRTRGSSARKHTHPDTCVLMDEMTRHGSRPLGEDMEDAASKQGGSDDRTPAISETEIMPATSGKETSHC